MEQENTKTIAAISTPQAMGGIGMIRISGPNARKVAGRVFRSKSGRTLESIGGYSCLYGRIYDGEEAVDEAIAINYRSPASFTGEDVVELSCHGGLYIMRRVLQVVLAAGASPAGPGEFTKRAFLNGKLGLTEAESVMQIISAQGEQASRAAIAGHDGALERRIHSIRKDLLATAAHLEAWADYPEDDIPEIDQGALAKSLANALSEIRLLLAQFDAGKAIREGVRTVIAGRPNVGKSTLMNLLAGCERSIVTEYAGTTRDIVEDTVLLGGVPLHLADTAGIRETSDPVESIGVSRALERVKSAQLVLAVFDSSQVLSEEDFELIASVQTAPCVAVVNKSDLSNLIDLTYIQSYFKHIVYISALSGDGITALEREVSAVLQTDQVNFSEGVLATDRQRDAARKAEESICETLAALQAGITLDAVTVSLEGAITALLELTGERATEAVVDQVFARFCVGK